MKQVKRAVLCGLSMLLLAVMPGFVSLAEEGYTMESPEHHKRVATNGDGTYTLTLDVTGKVENVSSTVPADVLVIVDTSGSMEEAIGQTTRLKKMQELIGHLADELLYSGSMNQMSLIRFSGSVYSDTEEYNDGEVLCQWTGSADDVKASVGQTESSGGTNWQAGFYEAANHLGSWRDGSKKYVVFVSDGNPTYYYGSKRGYYGKGWTVGNGDRYDATGYSKAISEASPIVNGKTFYSVGIGGSAEHMSDFANDLGGKYYNGIDAKALDEAFEDIIISIEQNYKDIVIQDTLSEYADLVEGTEYVLRATDAEGKEYELPKGTTVDYDADTKTVTWSFPKGYVLGHGVTYSISFHIKPSKKAEQTYATEESYPHVGEKDTGEISSGKEGYHCNKNAYVAYNGTSCGYPHPVIQVTKGTVKELPLAGGPGATSYIIAGLALILFAGTCLKIQKK